MKTDVHTSDNDINDRNEVHSEKVREILGSMPRGIARWGIAALFVIFMILIAVVMTFDYPYGDGESIFRHIFSGGY